MALSVVLGLVCLFAGRVSGVEFSPTHFQIREFHFYEIPLVHLQITPLRRTALSSDTAVHVNQKFLTVPPSKPDRWDLVRLTRGGIPRDDDAALLVDLLQTERKGNETWHRWSLDYPAAAAATWPQIAALARQGLYVVIPDVLAVARRTTDQVGDDAAAVAATVKTTAQSSTEVWVEDLRSAGLDRLADSIIAGGDNQSNGDQPAGDDLPGQ